MADYLLPLDEAVKRLRPFRRRHLGVRPIDVSRIIGTDSRGTDFDREFRALKPHVRERQQRVKKAFPAGDFPPIVVEKLGDAYFVVDGHHRVAIARRWQMATIDADVTELTARWHLGSDASCLELTHAEQERIFMTESGLVDVRPNARIRVSRVVGYRQLLETIQIHGYGLMQDAGRALERREIALDWYECVYLPAVEVIEGEDLNRFCARATVTDRFIWVLEQRRELSIEHDALRLAEVIRLATEKNARSMGGVRRLLRQSR